MERYYHIAKLRRDHGVRINGDKLRVDLSAITESDHIMNDVKLLEHVGPETVFFFSGGGTYLLNQRYLLTVQREATARVNPGQFSLFNGRADGPAEWENPPSVIRELFEELLVYENETLLYPREATFQSSIDAVYQAEKRTSDKSLPLKLVTMQNGTLEVVRDNTTLYENTAFWTISAQGEINLLYLFNITGDLAQLSARDGEGKRLIAALDLIENSYCALTLPPHEREWVSAANLPMSVNLRAVYDYLKHHPELLKA